MNKPSAARLKQALIEQAYVKYPSIPKHHITVNPPTDSDANGLTKCIVQYLLAKNHFAERITTSGRVIDNRKEASDVTGRKYSIGSTKYIPTTGTVGSADISAEIRRLGEQYAVPVKIEVKFKKDKQSDQQKVYQSNVEKAGAVYIIARDFDSFLEWYDQFMDEMVIRRRVE